MLGVGVVPGSNALLARLRSLVDSARTAEAERLITELRLAGMDEPALDEAELMLAFLTEDVNRAVGVSDAMAAARLVRKRARSPIADAFAVVAYLYAGRIESATRLLDAMRPSPAQLVARYYLGLAVDDPECPIPGVTGTPLDVLAGRAKLLRGDLRWLHETYESAWAEAASAWPILSAHLAAVPPAELPSSQRRAVGALVRGGALVDAHDLERAREAVAEARVESIAVGSTMLFAAALRLDAELALTLEHDGRRAVAVLDEWLADGLGTEIAAAREQAEMWRGAALLLLQQDQVALDRLTASVASMRAGRRLLELPRALVFLAEALRRLGSTERARVQTDDALAAASDQGSYLRLVRGLALFPKVLGARVADEPIPGSEWRWLARAVHTPRATPHSGVPTLAHLVEFGEISLVVGATRIAPPIARSAELLAYLATRPSMRATREDILTSLWDGVADARSAAYLRKTVQLLRSILPPPLTIERAGDGLLLRHGSVVLDSELLTDLLARASRLEKPGRADLFRQAIALHERGEYLPGCASGWTNRRRERLDGLIADARLDLGEIVLAAGDPVQAWELAEMIVAAEPLTERAWRLRMEAAAAMGDDEGVLSAFLECRNRLSAIDLEPSPETLALARRLRLAH